MATNKDQMKDKFASKRNKLATAEATPIRDIPTKGAEAFFDSSENTIKQLDEKITQEQEAPIAEKAVQNNPVVTTSKKSATSAKTSSTAKKKQVQKSEPAESNEEEGEVVKTTVYIDEDNFLALEEIQLKLKRKEKRRVTKNELFNKAIELLIEHYD